MKEKIFEIKAKTILINLFRNIYEQFFINDIEFIQYREEKNNNLKEMEKINILSYPIEKATFYKYYDITEYHRDKLSYKEALELIQTHLKLKYLKAKEVIEYMEKLEKTLKSKELKCKYLKI